MKCKSLEHRESLVFIRKMETKEFTFFKEQENKGIYFLAEEKQRDLYLRSSRTKGFIF